MKKSEFLWIFLVVLVVIVLTYVNLSAALLRSRDLQRRNDIQAIADGLIAYFEDFSSYPQSSVDGKIMACNGPCEWGKDPLRDINDPDYPPYISTLPADPQSATGASFYYLSSGRVFQLFTSLEGGVTAEEYNAEIAQRNLPCGNRVCSYGRAHAQAPLGKTIEEYEIEQRMKKLMNKVE